MSYQSWALKYRPKSIKDLIGQKLIQQVLTNIILKDEVPNALLLSGLGGTGKTTAARILAASLNCKAFDTPTLTPCGECVNCRSVWSSSSLDVIELDAAQKNGVDDIRELSQTVQLHALNARYRIVIMDECHRLSKQSQSAFLKTLEEPPQKVCFVLCTTEPQVLLQPIIRRCRHLRFNKVANSELKHHLQKIANQENLTITEDEALIKLINATNGSLGDAIQNLELISTSSLPVSLQSVCEVLQLPNADLMFNLVLALLEAKYESVILVQRLLLEKTKPDVILIELQKVLRDLYVLEKIESTTMLDSLISKANLLKLLEVSNASLIQTLLLLIRERQKTILGANNPEVGLDVLLLNIASFSDF